MRHRGPVPPIRILDGPFRPLLFPIRIASQPQNPSMLSKSLRTNWTCCLLASVLLGLPAPHAGAAAQCSEDPGTEGDGNITIGPDYTKDPDLTDLGNPKGR